MTREDREKAIEILRADDISEYSVEDILSARDMAIKSLELEPCCNCIMFKRYAKQMGFEMEQEPKSEWERDHEILKAYSNGANEVLDKIRAEVERLQKMCNRNNLNLMKQYLTLGMVLDIIDKYKAGSEE